ncbi:putative conserved membrane protein [Synechococcus sp. PROS-9-1]|uniref:hypothetical protein n=1 Tax=Synechococcus sp. PROS-9-1 TaxID=1968775 RepID=UPI00164522A6|nr:hypothetical protein [Synechococcus sp. PROS-9-1]QNJ33112.1 putative conserved membrane protein [Synechococcus sp. PROS-9-1]|tara:strand:- start:1770 stop:2090 length:321 start_codon:yes stop_codon:yes gene_type:complete
MNSGVVSTGNRSQIAIATGFLGAFIVGSLAVQMVLSQGGVAIDGTRPNAQVEPVIASPATLWADMGSRSELVEQLSSSTATNASPKAVVDPVVGSEATLWSALGSR